MAEDKKLLTVSASPHVKSPDTVSGIMRDVIIALIPAAIVSVFIFGWRAALIIALCVICCIGFEYLSRKIMKRSNTIGDLSCIVTGILLAFNLPVNTADLSMTVWMCIIGSFVAIVVVKQFFGGIGQNFANPAITARIVLLVSFASSMTKFGTPLQVDAVASATPLSLLSKTVGEGAVSIDSLEGLPSITQMFLGLRAGCLGEVCIVALLIGAAYLLIRRVISIAIPGSYILTVAIFMFIASGFNAKFTLYEVLGGGLILGAFFMATDYTTSPINLKGKIVFGIGCGILTSVIRLYGSLTEGVSYSILLMNIACPLIEKATAPSFFGYIKKKKEKKSKEAAA